MGHILPTAALGGVSPDDLGKVFTFDLENGWGWYRAVDGVYEEPEPGLYYEKSVRLRVDEFVKPGGIARGIFGTLVGGAADGLKSDVLAVPWSDGLDYDLSINPCRCWLLCFGASGYHLSDDGELALPARHVRGWGHFIPTDTKIYHAVILDQAEDAYIRVTVFATNSTEAVHQLEEKYGKGSVVDCHSSEDAEKPL